MAGSIARVAPLIAALAAVGIALGLAVASSGAESADNPPPPRNALLSNMGSRVEVNPRYAPGFRRAGYKDMFLLARRDDRAYYRVTRQDGRTCYAVGESRTVGTPGQISCWRARTQVLMDFSVVGATRGKGFRFYRVEGIAADEVSAVAIKDANGQVLARVPVVGNVYYLASPPTAAGSVLVPLDRLGNALSSR